MLTLQCNSFWYLCQPSTHVQWRVHILEPCYFPPPWLHPTIGCNRDGGKCNGIPTNSSNQRDKISHASPALCFFTTQQFPIAEWSKIRMYVAQPTEVVNLYNTEDTVKHSWNSIGPCSMQKRSLSEQSNWNFRARIDIYLGPTISADPNKMFKRWRTNATAR